MIAAVFARIVGVVLGGLPALATSVSAECAWVSRTVRRALGDGRSSETTGRKS